MSSFPRYPCRWAAKIGAIALLLITCRLQVTASPSVTLPILFDANDLLGFRFEESSRDSLRLRVGGAASGMNNVGSIWAIDEDGQPARDFDNTRAYAVLQTTEWIRLAHRGWWIGCGRGMRDAYEGNADAGQLWIDLHADGKTQPAYAPAVSSVRIEASWWAVGRTFPFRAGEVRGTGDLVLRRITADDYLARSLVGKVEGEDFSGMLKAISSETAAGTVRGHGWSLDVQGRFTLGTNWEGQITAEGLLGEVSWRGLYVEDGYILSPRVFTDREGFLHDCGGISGMGWHEDLTARINPFYRLDLVYMRRPNVLLGAAWQSGTRTVPNIGLAWPQPKPWLPYLRCYPTQNRLEIGAVGRGWQIRVSGDDWLDASPKHAEIALTVSPLRF